MKDVFEPSLSMNKTNVFEPTSNFYKITPDMIKSGIEIGGQLLGSLGGGKSNELRTQLSASGSKENADLLSCRENVVVDGFFGSLGLDLKKKQNRIRTCQEGVRARYENERKELRRQLEEQTKLREKELSLQKASLESNERISLQTQPKATEPEKKSNKGLIIGLSVGGGVLVLATVLILVLRKKK
jgi:hypothetical protein